MSETSVGIIRREERLKLEVFRDDEAAAEAAAEILAPQAKIPVAEHGRFVMAASAGRTTPSAASNRYGQRGALVVS